MVGELYIIHVKYGGRKGKVLHSTRALSATMNLCSHLWILEYLRPGWEGSERGGVVVHQADEKKTNMRRDIEKFRSLSTLMCNLGLSLHSCISVFRHLCGIMMSNYNQINFRLATRRAHWISAVPVIPSSIKHLITLNSCRMWDRGSGMALRL